MLSFENLKILSSSNQSSEKAKIISALLETNYLRNGEDLYKINTDNLTVECIDRSRSDNIILKEIQDILFKFR